MCNNQLSTLINAVDLSCQRYSILLINEINHLRPVMYTRARVLVRVFVLFDANEAFMPIRPMVIDVNEFESQYIFYCPENALEIPSEKNLCSSCVNAVTRTLPLVDTSKA